MKENKMIKFFSGVYLWMFIGLIVSSIVAYFSSTSITMLRFISKFYLFIILAEIIVVIGINRIRQNANANTSKILFILYSGLNGLTFASIFLAFNLKSIVNVFAIASFLFLFFALYGYFTKSDLSSIGRMLFVGLIAVIILSLINIFIRNSNFDIALSIITVVLFLGLTIYDMQNLKRIYNYYSVDEKELKNATIFGALDLYLDFVNIFINLLKLFGNGSDN